MSASSRSSSDPAKPVKEEEGSHSMDKFGFKLAEGTLNGDPVYDMSIISCAACSSQGRPCLARAVKPGSSPQHFRTTKCKNCFQGNGQGSCSLATYRGVLEWKWDAEAGVFLKVSKPGKPGKPDTPNGTRSAGTGVKAERVEDANEPKTGVKRKRDDEEDDTALPTGTRSLALSPSASLAAADEKEKLEAALKTAENEITKLSAEVDAHTTTLVVFQEAFEASESKIDSLKVDLESRDREIEMLKSDLKDRHSHIKALEADLEHEKAMVTWLDADDVAYQSTVQNTENEVASRDITIAVLKSTVAKCQNQMKTLIQESSSKIKQLEIALNDRNLKIQKLEEAVSYLDANVTDLQRRANPSGTEADAGQDPHE